MRFWDEFQRLGGVDALGYPISRRFTWKGFTVQAMQKGVLMVRTGVGTLKIGPPLNIPEDAALEGIQAIGEALDECFAERGAGGR